MGQRGLRIVQLAQRDEAREPFQIGIVGTAGQIVPGGESIGRSCLAGAHPFADQIGAALGPGFGPAERLCAGRAVEEQRHHLVGAVAPGAPFHPLEGKPGIAGQCRRHRGDLQVHPRSVHPEREPRIRQRAPALGHPGTLPLHRGGGVGPEHRVHAGDLVVGQRLAIDRHQRAFRQRPQRQRLPGADRKRPRLVAAPRGLQRRRQSQHAVAGLRLVGAEEGEDGLGRRIGGDRRLAADLQRRHAGPVAMVLQEGHVIREAALAGAEPVPGDDGGHRRGLAPDLGGRGLPVAVAHRGHGRGQIGRHRFGRAERRHHRQLSPDPHHPSRSTCPVPPARSPGRANPPRPVPGLARTLPEPAGICTCLRSPGPLPAAILATGPPPCM